MSFESSSVAPKPITECLYVAKRSVAPTRPENPAWPLCSSTSLAGHAADGLGQFPHAGTIAIQPGFVQQLRVGFLGPPGAVVASEPLA